MKISRYTIEHEADVLTAIGEDPNWEFLISSDKKDFYKTCLLEGVSYVCYSNNEFCGYIRAILDPGFAVYISELFIVPKWRSKKIGQLLIEQVANENPKLTVYALSDEDAYYIKKGYKKIGSVFEI
ncbi:MAG: GNAT family N-acetyltransferase [Proteobacteria bacterium]|nr:GNAT family N-acetyltransferase [Pseudomonadota bacterium]